METVRRYRCGWSYGGPAWMTASPGTSRSAVPTARGWPRGTQPTLNARRVCTVAGITSVPVAVGLDAEAFWDLVVAAVVALG